MPSLLLSMIPWIHFDVVETLSKHSADTTWAPFDVRDRVASNLLRRRRLFHGHLVDILVHFEHHELRQWPGKDGVLRSRSTGDGLMVGDGVRRFRLFGFGIGHRGQGDWTAATRRIRLLVMREMGLEFGEGALGFRDKSVGDGSDVLLRLGECHFGESYLEGIWLSSECGEVFAV